MNALKLITFDVTGTLLRLQPMPAIVYSQNAKDFGLNISADAISSHFKPEWKKLSKEHPNFGAHSGIGWQKWWKTFVKNTLVKAEPTLSYDDKKLDLLSEYLINEYKTAKWWELTEGASDILDDLKVADIAVGVISNFDSRLESVLEAVGIKQYFKFVLTSYSVGVMKPDKQIFKAAELQVPNIKPSNCLHVGNDIELDYKGAVNAGWSAAAIDSTLKTNFTKETHKQNIFMSLKDLQNQLKHQNYINFST